MIFPDLLAEADRYARLPMKKHGKLAPVMMAATPEGMILFTPNGLTDTGMKDDFPNKVKLITASHGAKAMVLIVESWFMRARSDQPLDQLLTNEDAATFAVRWALLRAELDAFYARFACLYGLNRDELRYILDPADDKGPDYPSESFRVLKTNELKQFGEYRTRRLLLEAWDQQNPVTPVT